MKLALAGNPNSGKTTLFNALTGSNQFVGNWPGVTVEKKEGKLKQDQSIEIMDLPGIYSLSPYTPEEVVSRNYLLSEKPDCIVNIVDGMNLERNLYLTTQLMDLGIPMVLAVNMMDLVKANGDELVLNKLSEALGIPCVAISALNKTGLDDLLTGIKQASVPKVLNYGNEIEQTISELAGIVTGEPKRWYAIKLLERDKECDANQLKQAEPIISALEETLEDDGESLMTDARYTVLSQIVGTCYKKNHTHSESTSDKIDRIVTNRWLGLPIFAIVMFLVYWIAMGPLGSTLTDWANDGVFGDGWHLFGIGTADYEEAMETYGNSDEIIEAFLEETTYEMPETLEDFEALVGETSISYEVMDEDTLFTESFIASADDIKEAGVQYFDTSYKSEKGAPASEEYGIFVPGIPVLVTNGLEALGVADWLQSLINDGIVAGVGAVLGFVPQLLILFFLLAFLEGCGYMARIAFVLDRVFRKFGLSGKSFIPMLIGTGCGVPGIMAGRTIENERDRRITIMTTTFIPCGAKVPFISMMALAIFAGSSKIAVSAYFLGMAAIVCSGVILKKTKLFKGDAAPFVMELPAYHMPKLSNLLRNMWDKGFAFIQRAGTLILLSTILVWFCSNFGIVDGAFTMLEEEMLDQSFMAVVGNALSWIFKPLGWGTWQATVGTISGLVAKENIVGTLGVLYGGEGNFYGTLRNSFTPVTGYSFLCFNLLCAPCFAAIGAIKREMNSPKWTWIAIGYQCVLAYAVAFVVTQLGNVLVLKQAFNLMTLLAMSLVVLLGYGLFRKA